MEENSVNRVKHQTEEQNPPTLQGTSRVNLREKSKPMYPTHLYVC